MLADLTGTGRSQVGGGLGPLEPELSGTLTTLPSENHSWTASKALEFVSRKSRWHWWISPPLTVHRRGCKELNDSLQTCDGLKSPSPIRVLRLCWHCPLCDEVILLGHTKDSRGNTRHVLWPFTVIIPPGCSWVTKNLVSSTGLTTETEMGFRRLSAEPPWGTQCIHYNVLALRRAWEPLGVAYN